MTKSRVRAHSDAVIGICGREGLGKSSLGLILGYFFDKNFDLVDNILYSPKEEELDEKIKKMKKGSVLDLDEAVKMLEKQEWMKQTFIKKLFQVIRSKGFITLLLIPRLEDLNEYFRNWRVFMKINVIYRGVAFVQMADTTNPTDVWNTSYNQTVLANTLGNNTFETADRELVYRAISKFKGFIGFVNFPEVPKNIYKIYEGYKEAFSLQNLQKEERVKEKEPSAYTKEKTEKKNKMLKGTVEWLINEGFNKTDIAKKLDVNMTTIRTILGEI